MSELWNEIASLTRRDLEKQKKLLPESDVIAMCQLKRPVRDLAKALKRGEANAAPRILGRIQKAEPESGFLREEFDALELAKALQSAGSAALAVVTEPHLYLGKNSTLSGVSRLATVPVVRWDCMVEPYQIAQTYLWGADGVTLFPAVLDQSELVSLAACAAELNLGVVGIAFSGTELERLLTVNSIAAIGVTEAALLAQIPAEKTRIFCGETPESGFDAWSPERLVMQSDDADELKRIFRRK